MMWALMHCASNWFNAEIGRKPPCQRKRRMTDLNSSTSVALWRAWLLRVSTASPLLSIWKLEANDSSINLEGRRSMQEEYLLKTGKAFRIKTTIRPNFYDIIYMLSYYKHKIYIVQQTAIGCRHRNPVAFDLKKAVFNVNDNACKERTPRVDTTKCSNRVANWITAALNSFRLSLPTPRRRQWRPLAECRTADSGAPVVHEKSSPSAMRWFAAVRFLRRPATRSSPSDRRPRPSCRQRRAADASCAGLRRRRWPPACQRTGRRLRPARRRSLVGALRSPCPPPTGTRYGARRRRLEAKDRRQPPRQQLRRRHLR